MKRLFLLFLLPLLFSFSHRVQAQFGVKAGLNAAVLNGDNIGLDTKYTYSWHGGVFYNYNLVGPLSIRPELLYSLQGSQFKSAVENYKNELHYLDLPILVDVKISRLHLQAGPQFGLLVNAKEDGTMQTGTAADGSAEYGRVDQQITSQYKRGDFGIAAGAELQLIGGLRFGARFNTSLVDINDHKNISGVNDPRLQNRVIQAYLAFQLGGND